MDEDNPMADSPARPSRPSLIGLVAYLANQQSAILEQWLLSVHRDTQIESADRLPHHQLVDHLPRLLGELCEFLRARDADLLTGEARRNASQHGEMRWQDGYKIDELLRELEVFRQLVASTLFRYREVDADFGGPAEVSANAQVHQFFAEITVASTRQFMHEQKALTHDFARELAVAQQELGRASARLSQSVKERERTFAIVAHELKNLLRTVPQSGEAATAVEELHGFVQQVLEYASLSGEPGNPQLAPFDPRALFSELVATYRPLVEAKGLHLRTECATAPAGVVGDRRKIRRIAEILLDRAIGTTTSGHILFAFVFPDTKRWQINVSDTGSGLSGEAAQELLGGPATTFDGPVPGPGLAIAKELIGLLGGVLNTESRSGAGMRMTVTLPQPQN
jgi:signal transduction histidine kinase